MHCMWKICDHDSLTYISLGKKKNTNFDLNPNPNPNPKIQSITSFLYDKK